MKNWLTIVLLGASVFGSLALTAAVPVLAQRAGAKAAVCTTYFGRGAPQTEAQKLTAQRYRCHQVGSVV